MIRGWGIRERKKMKFLDTTLYLVTIKYLSSSDEGDDEIEPSEETVYVLGDYISDMLDTLELEPMKGCIILSFKVDDIRNGLFDARHPEP